MQDSAKHYVFVGSAGAYDANPIEPLHVEGDKRKAKAGHVGVEKYLEEANAPFTVFQPQYIYGPYTAKVKSWSCFLPLARCPYQVTGLLKKSLLLEISLREIVRCLSDLLVTLHIEIQSSASAYCWSRSLSV